jgi:hypothetical protein
MVEVALIPVVNSTWYYLHNSWLAYLQKLTNIWHSSPPIPQVALVCLTLYGQRCIRYENVFTSCGRGHKTFLGPHALGAWPWLSRMADITVHIFRDRLSTCKPLLERRVRDSHHLTKCFHIFQETYSLLILITVQDTLVPYLALGEPSNFTAFE